MMTGDEFIQLAGKLALTATGACARSAASRAYYGAFHIASDLLRSLGYPLKGNANDHQDVPRILDRMGHPEAKQAAGLLGDLHTLRNRADYKLQDMRPENQKNALESVETAETVRTLLGRCGSSLPRARSPLK